MEMKVLFLWCFHVHTAELCKATEEVLNVVYSVGFKVDELRWCLFYTFEPFIQSRTKYLKMPSRCFNTSQNSPAVNYNAFFPHNNISNS